MTDNKEVILQSRIEKLEAEKAELIESLLYFVNRVEEGSIRSKKTYAMYKSLLEEHGVK